MTDPATPPPRVEQRLDRLDAPAAVPFDWKNLRAARGYSASGARDRAGRR